MMVNKAHIETSLYQIDRLYKKSLMDRRGNRRALFYSKLAIIELCGWIEESMDSIIEMLSDKHLSEADNRDYIHNSVIRCTHGFHYNKNFRIMLINIIGLINVERLESKLDKHKFHSMKSNLGSLKVCRDQQAHIHIKGTTTSIDTPSITRNRFIKVYEGLKDVELYCRKMRV